MGNTDFGLDEWLKTSDRQVCDWCGTPQIVEQSFDLRRMLCVDQGACLSRIPPSAKNHSMSGKDIITFSCAIPHCEGRSIRQGNFCTKHTSYTDASLKANIAPHGSVRRYKSGCSCTKCKRANAEYKILIKDLDTYLSNEDESYVVEDLENWVRHILDILYSGSPGKQVVKVYDENHKIKYEIQSISDLEAYNLSDELSQSTAQQTTQASQGDSDLGASDEPQ